MNKDNDFKEDRLIVYERLVRQNFRFLEDEYGFILTSKEVHNEHIVISYMSETVFVNLYYGPPGFELELSFGRRGIDDLPGSTSYGMGDLARLDEAKGRHWESRVTFQANSFHNLCRCLPKLARLLKTYGGACLKGESATYEEMSVEREIGLLKYRIREELARMRSAAARAWKAKDYTEVVKLLEPFVEELTVAECRKLEYCRRRS